jgi:outer membrane protein assembly factor BamB
VDGNLVYGLGQFGDLVCADIKDGKERWRESLKADFGGKEGGWNYTESPLVDGEKLIVTPGGKDSTMIALSKKDGAVIWKGVVPDGETAGYSSVVAADIGGTRQYVQLMSNGLAAFSADKGELLWRYGTEQNRFARNTANIPTPIVIGDQVFATAGYGRGGALVSISSSGGKFNAKEEYWKNELNNKHGGVILVGDNLFGDIDSNGQPWCAALKDGKIKWKMERGKGNGSASLTFADGLLYIRFANGWVSLVNPESGKEISSFKVPNGTRDCWAHPVVVGGKLYVREQNTLWCYEVKAK